MLHSIYDQPDDEAVHAHFDRFIQALAEKLPRSPSTSRKLGLDVLAFTVFPKEIWRQIWFNNPRLNREIRRCTKLSPRAILYLRSRSSRAAAILPHGRWTGRL
jgi:putative transposase